MKQISAKPDCARLAELRSRVTTEQRKLLDQFWQEAKATDQWPICRVVHSQLRKTKVKDLLNPLGGDVVYERDGQNEGSCYALTLLGVLLTSEGNEHFKMLFDCIGFMQRKFLDESKQRRFKDMTVIASLGWSELQRESMARLCRLSLIPWAGSIGNDSWELRAPDEVEDWEPSQTFEAILDSALFRYFRADRAVLAEDRRKQDAANSQPFGHSPFGWSPWEGLRQSPPANPTPPAIDPLKRRYQVFVSSTFEDLKEERQHVMQALLESKCIPTGMELFPATSAEQWELIKRVIDECDYYMVIVAGRYGSIGKTGVGYTEMEFDYATQSGKPVIGFYHQNPELLVGAKLEGTSENPLF
jgi:hypothetical protein